MSLIDPNLLSNEILRDLGPVVSETIANLQKIALEFNRVMEEMALERRNAVVPVLKALGEAGLVSLIYIRGWTPAFNDGEPCIHTTDIRVNIAGLEELACYPTELPSELIEGIKKTLHWNSDTGTLFQSSSAIEHNIELCRKHGHVYEEPDGPVIELLADLLIPIADEEHGTNYYVLYLYKDGEWEVHSGSYDCGY